MAAAGGPIPFNIPQVSGEMGLVWEKDLSKVQQIQWKADNDYFRPCAPQALLQLLHSAVVGKTATDNP